MGVAGAERDDGSRHRGDGDMKQAETFVYTAIAVYCPSVSDTPVLKRLT